MGNRMCSVLRIALFGNMKKKAPFEAARAIIPFLRARSVEVVMREGFEELGVLSLASIEPSLIDCIITLGGDGTILRLKQQHKELEAPIFGVNLGQLGFMAEIPLDQVYPALEELLKGNYRTERRIMLEGSKEELYHEAVNEIVFHRGSNPSLIDLSVKVDGVYLNTFSADGLICATPSGSTAYSLSAGGPILAPELEALVITPISAHTISNRPIVLMPKETVEICYLSDLNPIEVIYDGFSTYPLKSYERVVIRKSAHYFTMVILPGTDYFATLRTKLGWVGHLRYSQRV